MTAPAMIRTGAKPSSLDINPDLAEAFPLAIFPDTISLPVEGRERLDHALAAVETRPRTLDAINTGFDLIHAGESIRGLLID